MSLIINVYTKSKTKNFSAVISGDSLYCCIADDDKNILDYFFLPLSGLDDLKALSFTAIAKYVKDNRSYTPFPPTENTDNKIAINTPCDSVGVVTSEGDSLLMSADVNPFVCMAELKQSFEPCPNCEPEFYSCCAKRTLFQKIGFITQNLKHPKHDWGFK